MKRLISLILAGTMLISMSAAAANDGIKITVDNEDVEFSAEPFIDSDRVLVPVRDVFESMGAVVFWLDETRTVIIQNKEDSIEISMNDPTMYMKHIDPKRMIGNSGRLDAPARIVNDRVYVPLRDIAEMLGCELEWNGESRTVSIKSSDNDIAVDESLVRDTLIGYDIVTEDDMDKGGNITTIEALETISKIENGSIPNRTGLWDMIDDLRPSDGLDDDTKNMLLSIALSNKGIVKVQEIPEIDLGAELTEYTALVYLTRMVGSTYGCTDTTEELDFTEPEQTYERAAEKGLITDADMSKMDEKISRSDFYTLLVKALYTQYYEGGYPGVSKVREITYLAARKELADRAKNN